MRVCVCVYVYPLLVGLGRRRVRLDLRLGDEVQLSRTINFSLYPLENLKLFRQKVVRVQVSFRRLYWLPPPFRETISQYLVLDRNLVSLCLFSSLSLLSVPLYHCLDPVLGVEDFSLTHGLLPRFYWSEVGQYDYPKNGCRECQSSVVSNSSGLWTSGFGIPELPPQRSRSSIKTCRTRLTIRPTFGSIHTLSTFQICLSRSENPSFSLSWYSVDGVMVEERDGDTVSDYWNPVPLPLTDTINRVRDQNTHKSK